MPSPQEFNFEDLARQIAVARSEEIGRSPEAAAQICIEIIIPAVTSTRERQDPRLTVSAVCRGVMGGLFMKEKDFAPPCVEILKAMAALSHKIQIDPADMMTWAMEGLAAIAILAPLETRSQIQSAIDENFMGAGAVFNELCEKAKQALKP